MRGGQGSAPWYGIVDDAHRARSPDLTAGRSVALAAEFILYVRDQRAAADFYARVLGVPPSLDVPGMTEFSLGPGYTLGLMPESGIKRLLGDALPDPEAGRGVPRAELYLLVDDPAEFHRRALAQGAVELGPLALRGWGDEAAYSLDPDGHVLVFARRSAAVSGAGS